MLHVPGMPEGVHVSFSPEDQPVSAPAQSDRYTPPALVGAGTPSEALTVLLDAHELAYGHALCSEAYGLPDLAERRQAEEDAFRALLHTPMHSDADRVAYASAVISRQMHSLGDGSAIERDHPMAVAYRNLRFGEHAREPEEMRHVGRIGEPKISPDPILTAIEEQQRLNREHEVLLTACCGELDNHPSWVPQRSAHNAMWDHWRDIVLKTVPQTAQGCRALATYALEFVEYQGTGFEEEAPILLDLIARSPLARSAGVNTPCPQVSATADPILAVIEAHQTAYAAWEPLMLAWNDTLNGTPDYEAAEAAEAPARQAERDAFQAVLDTRPTTPNGLAMLAAYLPGAIRQADPDIDAPALAPLVTLSDSILALKYIDTGPVTGEARSEAAPDSTNPAKLAAEQVDLKTLDAQQLSHLHEAYQAARYAWEGVGGRPFSITSRDGFGFVHLSAAGELADFEEQRAGFIMDRIVAEMASRTPSNEKERDRSLVLRLRHELDCEDRIHDDAMMHEIAQAWGA